MTAKNVKIPTSGKEIKQQPLGPGTSRQMFDMRPYTRWGPNGPKQPKEPDPQPMPEASSEMIASKDKTKRSALKKGRRSTILAGMLNRKTSSSVMQFGKRHLGE